MVELMLVVQASFIKKLPLMKDLRKLLGLALILVLPLIAQAQQMNWKIPVNGTNADGTVVLPIESQLIDIDFSTGSPVYSMQDVTGPTLNNQHSTQAIANGKYCSGCLDDNLISEFVITGVTNNAYQEYFAAPIAGGSIGPLIEKTYSLAYNYDVGNCGSGQSVIYPKNSTTNTATHNSVSEIAVGAGPNNEGYWTVMQNAVRNQEFFTLGTSIAIDLVEFQGGTSPSYTARFEINSSTHSDLAGKLFHEGVALGPEFVYPATATNANPNFVGARCRSVYFATHDDFDDWPFVDGTIHQYLINVDNLTGEYIGEALSFVTDWPQSSPPTIVIEYRAITNQILSEMELSFPPTQDAHPEYIAIAGDQGVTMWGLDEVGRFVSGQINHLTGDANGNLGDPTFSVPEIDQTWGYGSYGLEFDPANNFLYFAQGNEARLFNSTAVELKRVPLNVLGFPRLADVQNVSNMVISGVSTNPKNMLIENAGNGSMYILGENRILYEIQNPSQTGAIPPVVFTKDLQDYLDNNGTGNNAEVGFGIPDWVNGELADGPQGLVDLEICIEKDPCNYGVVIGSGTTVPILVLLNDKPIESLVIQTGANQGPFCTVVQLCPGGNYDIVVGDTMVAPDTTGLGIIMADETFTYTLPFAGTPITASITCPSDLCLHETETITSSSNCPLGDCDYNWEVKYGNQATNFTGVDAINVQPTNFQPITISLTVSDPNVPFCRESASCSISVNRQVNVRTNVTPATCANGNLGSFCLLVSGAIRVDNWVFSDPNLTSTVAIPRRFCVDDVPPGTYSVNAEYGDCSTPVTVVVGGEICCPSYITDNYQLVQSVTYTTDQFWDNKILVDGTVTVTNGAILDISTVDVVFTETGEIVFEDGARLRANNSVFRPCEEAKTWLGLSFLGTSSGQVNECLFKAAEAGIYATMDGEVKVSNTEFTNCLTAIDLDNIEVYESSLTGNTFLVDELLAEAFDNLDITGVRLNLTGMDGIIAQNDFVQNEEPENGLFIGIALENSSVAIVGNKFTNLHRAIEAITPLILLVEDNEFELSRLVGNDLTQFNISQNSGNMGDFQVIIEGGVGGQTELFNNTFTTSNITSQDPATSRGAIWMIDRHDVVIKGNKIVGFNYGLLTGACDRVNVLDNTIENGGDVGIFITNGVGHNVRCNMIDMEYYIPAAPGTGPIGIGYMVQFGYIYPTPTTNVQIRNNCITETSIAIFLSHTDDDDVDLPMMTNNFLYNYEIGINIADDFGTTGARWLNNNIGDGSGVFAQEGRNTFASNNFAQGAIDINNNMAVAVTEGGNWGILNTTNVTAGGSANEFYSTATCGGQFSLDPGNTVTAQNIITDDETCYLTLGLISDLASRGSVALRVVGTTMTASKLYTASQSAVSLVYQQSGATVAKKLLADILNSGLVTGNYAKWLNYDMLILERSFDDARLQLLSIQPANQVEMDRRSVEHIKLNLALQFRSIESLSTSDVETLKQIDLRRDAHAAEARAILNRHFGASYNYIFDVPAYNKTGLDQIDRSINVSNDWIKVFPNPTESSVQVEYFIENIADAELVVTDILGKTVYTTAVAYNTTQLTIDMSAYTDGMYFVNIITDDGVKMSSKVVKR